MTTVLILVFLMVAGSLAGLTVWLMMRLETSELARQVLEDEIARLQFRLAALKTQEEFAP